MTPLRCPWTARLAAWLLAALLFPAAAAAGRTIEDIPYVPVTDPATSDTRMVDLYLPDGPRGFPTIVFVQGGLWTVCSRKFDFYRRIARDFQTSGVAFAVISHRTAPKHKHPALVQDVAAAFAWVKDNIGTYGGAPDRVFLLGHSSGGHLVAIVASSDRYLAPHGLARSDIRGCIMVGPVLDLDSEPYIDSPDGASSDRYIVTAFGRDPVVLREASPLQHVTRGFPKTLLVYAGQESPTVAMQMETFARRALRAGVEVTIVTAPCRDHKTAMLDMGVRGDRTLAIIVEQIRRW